MESIYISLFSGIISSCVTVFFIFIFSKPRLKVSKYIALEEDVFFFKFVNLGLFSLINTKITLKKYIEEDGYPDGKLIDSKTLKIKTDSFPYISGFLKGTLNLRKDHCVQVKHKKSEDDLDKIVLENSSYIVLIIYTQHSITGVNNVIRKEFKNRHYIIRNSSFECGNKIFRKLKPMKKS